LVNPFNEILPIMDNLLAYSNLILSVVIALATVAMAVFAYQQHRLEKSNYQLQLFDKRYKIYEVINKRLSIILQTERFDNDDWLELIRGTQDAKFLFKDDKVQQYIELFTKNCCVLQESCQTNNGQGIAECFNWFKDQGKVIDELFEPYLKLDK